MYILFSTVIHNCQVESSYKITAKPREQPTKSQFIENNQTSSFKVTSNSN